MIIGIISSYLFYKTESVWCSVLFHASINGMDKWAPSSMFMSEDANKFIGPDLLGIIGGIGFVVIASIAFLRLREIKEYPSHDVFIADVVSVNADENILDEQGKIDFEKANLITYVGQKYFANNKKIGYRGIGIEK
jgi:hypothetical protein